MRTIRNVFIIAGLALFCVWVITLCGCAPQKVQVEGGQTHEVNVHHDPQRTDIWIHRDRRRHPNPPPPK